MTQRVANRFKSFVLMLAVSVTLVLVNSCDLHSQDPLVSGFVRPPHEAKPWVYWIWLNGYVNRDSIDNELKAFADHGIGGVLIFDMGATGDPRFVPPAGPAFMGAESLDNIAFAVDRAKQHGLDVQLAVCSSWDMGGDWVRPQDASMALYKSELAVVGPATLDTRFPKPKLPDEIPRDVSGEPLFSHEVALIAVPDSRRLPGHEFIFHLPGNNKTPLDHLILYNNAKKSSDDTYCGTKEVSVSVSSAGRNNEDFVEIFHGNLEPHDRPQRFDFAELKAGWVKLQILSGYDPEKKRIELGEFEIYNKSGLNLAGSHEADRKREAAELVSASSEKAEGNKWTAANLHDGVRSGPAGSWATEGPPPAIIENVTDVVNLSSNLDSSGNVKWEVPAGRWTLMRFVCGNTGERLKIPSPKSNGLATDHFSSSATEQFLTTLLDRLESRLGSLAKSGIKQLYIPSYEVRGLLWTPDFLDQYKKNRGYDMTPYLPALFGYHIESEERTRRFQKDFQKMRGHLLVEAFYREASRVTHERGLAIEAEAGGPGPPVHQVPVDALQALGAVDEMRGEFWPWRPQMSQLWVVKETASAAHIYGRNKVHMESFTGFRHWQDGPFELKPSADRAFCEGMNHVVWHTATHQPPEAGKPGWVYGAGTHLTPNLVWWPMAKPFLDYLARCSFLLQQGRFVGDVCYYYGDEGARFVPPKHINPSLGTGYDYDVTNSEVILNQMDVKQDRITLPNGMAYEILVLRESASFDLEVLNKVENLILAGATVVGPKPTEASGLSDYPARDRLVQEVADRVWGECDGKTVLERDYGRGKIIWGKTLKEVLQDKKIGPDFQFAIDGRDATFETVDYIHRHTDEVDIYFVSNKHAQPAKGIASFRVGNKLPEIWRPDTGKITPLPVYEGVGDTTEVSLAFDPHDAYFVLFRKEAPPLHITTIEPPQEVVSAAETRLTLASDESGIVRLKNSANQSSDYEVPVLPSPLEVRGPWQVRFPFQGNPTKTITLDQLACWSNLSDETVRYFSGTASYETNLEVPNSWHGKQYRVRLDLGSLWAVARVTLNGKVFEPLWKPPFQLDVTNSLQSGLNTLQIEIANTWVNRLVGDAIITDQQPFTRTNIQTTGAPENPGVPWRDVPIRDSGLIGPVKLIPQFEKSLELRELEFGKLE